MTMPNHSPLPWRIATVKPDEIASDIYADNGHVFIASVNARPLRRRDAEYAEIEANAALIVRAVNAHDQLVAALENLIAAENEYGDPDNVAVNQALAAATSALASAKGTA